MKNYEQGSSAWLLMRKSKIGASDIPIIMGHSPWKTAYDLFLEKTDQVEAHFPNSAMLRGTMLEPIARALYISVSNNIVIPAVKISSEWDVAMASLDGIDETGKVLLEVKCPLNPKLYIDAVKNRIPQHYQDQMQWALWVTKAERCDYFVYMNELEYKLIPVYPDKAYQKKLLFQAKAFWAHILNGTEPDLSDRDYLYVQEVEPNKLAMKWRVIKEKEEELKRLREEIESKIKDKFSDQKCFFSEAKVKINIVERKGVINWTKLCSDKEISEKETEKYRKKSSSYSTFKIV